jgi:hypothetical protein
MLGVLVTAALPASVPALRNRPLLALLFSALFGWYAVLPTLDGWAAAFTWLIAVGAALVSCRLRRDSSGKHSLFGPLKLREVFRHTATGTLITAMAVVPLLIAWVAFYGEQHLRALTTSAGRDEVAVVTSGLLLAAFVGNDLAYLAVRPYLPKLKASSDNFDSIVPNGIFVGWVERAVIFAFVAGGQSDAAALAVAAKALIRLPEVQDEQKGSILAEYIIVGTLASVLVSIVAAVAIRLALGLSAL